MYLLVQGVLIMFASGISDFRLYYTDFGGITMAGSGRFPGWRIPTPMPGWQSCHPPVDPAEDHRAWPIVLGDHVEACYEGQRIVLIPDCELCVLLPRMMSQRADLRSQAAHIRAELDQALLTGWVPHNTDECFMRRRADQLEILMLVVEREARMSQAISHAIQRLLILNPLAVINGPFP